MSDIDNTGPTQDGCIPQFVAVLMFGWLLAHWFGWL